MAKKVVTLGEIMLRLSPPNYEKFVQADSLDVTYGGGEANVAAALCNYGLRAAFVSKVPDNALGQAAINHLRRYGVDTQFVARGGKRLGIYFLEKGASMRSSQVIYDRADSSFSEAELLEFDFDTIFSEVDWFNTSGITPALGEKPAALAEAALKAAKAKGITTSIDLNYRKKLWSREKANAVMPRLFKYTDICIGIEEDETIINAYSLDSYKNIFKRMKEKYGFKYIACAIRESHSASDNSWSGMAYDGEKFYQSKQYEVRIVDRVGSGDSFASGLIYGLITGMNLEDAVGFGVAASALKHTIPGDLNHATLSDVEELLKGDVSGKVNR